MKAEEIVSKRLSQKSDQRGLICRADASVRVLNLALAQTDPAQEWLDVDARRSRAGDREPGQRARGTRGHGRRRARTQPLPRRDRADRGWHDVTPLWPTIAGRATDIADRDASDPKT